MSTKLLNIAVSILFISISYYQANAQKIDAQSLNTSKTTATENVEIKLILRDDEAELARNNLKLLPEKAKQRVIYFYDTQDLSLFKQGIILRARETFGKTKGEITVKLLPMGYEQAKDVGNLKDFTCEFDAVGTSKTSACSITTKQKNKNIDNTFNHRLPIAQLFSTKQKRFAESKAKIDWAQLQIFEPAHAQVWTVKPLALKYPFTVEQWVLASGKVITEVSTRTPPSQDITAAKALQTYLSQLGLALADSQESKTSLTLGE